MTKLTIPASVTKIFDYAFKSSGISTIEIPSTVTNIGVNVFEG